MGENATLTRIEDSDIKIINGSVLEENISLKKDNGPQDMLLKEKSQQKNSLKITDTTLRDAHQSLLATRMTTKEMVPACEKLDAVGFYSMEVFGGGSYF